MIVNLNLQKNYNANTQGLIAVYLKDDYVIWTNVIIKSFVIGSKI